MAHLLALVDDLFFQAKINERARQLGVDPRTCTTAEVLASEAAKEMPKLIVVDLNARNDPIEAIERVRTGAADVPIVAFLSHVHTELAGRERAAGCRTVLPRSQFTRGLATILGQAKSESS
jgi:CheY-like chemotaxis protein